MTKEYLKRRNMKKQRNKSTILEGNLSIDQILELIDFEDEEVEHAARTLPKLFLEAARYRIRVLRKRQDMEQKLDAAKVDAAIYARTEAADSGTKITEGMVKEAVDSNDEVRAQSAAVAKYRSLEEFAKLVVECFRYKKSAIQVVASLAGAEAAVERYFDAVQSKEGLKNLRDRARERYEKKD